MVYPLLILAHVLADFPFQTNKISEDKQVSIFALIKHLLIIFFTSLVLTVHFLSFNLLLILVGITVIHGIIDYFRIYLTQKQKGNYNLELFLIDQVLHVLVILFFIPFIDLRLNFYFLSFFNKLRGIYDWLNFFDIKRVGFIAITASVLIFNFKGSTIIVRSTLKKYKSDLSSEGDKGKAIGNLERLLIILFVVLENYSLIGLLFTAKSLIRFKKIGEKGTEEGFVEYYLLGSFISIFLAVVTGSIINIFKYLW